MAKDFGFNVSLELHAKDDQGFNKNRLKAEMNGNTLHFFPWLEISRQGEFRDQS